MYAPYRRGLPPGCGAYYCGEAAREFRHEKKALRVTFNAGNWAARLAMRAPAQSFLTGC